MENETLLSRITVQDVDQGQTGDDSESILKFLVFTIGDALYALAAEDVREISSENEVYYVPFVPPYILGYTNRHGTPYTVFDLQMLFESKPVDGQMLLILKSEDDQMAICIGDVREIVRVAERDLCRITSDDEKSKYFLSAIDLSGREVFVLNVETLLTRLESDLG